MHLEFCFSITTSKGGGAGISRVHEGKVIRWDREEGDNEEIPGS